MNPYVGSGARGDKWARLLTHYADKSHCYSVIYSDMADMMKRCS